jgi:hypothetical protein
MQRSTGFVAIALGTIAILALLGILRPLPAYVGFFAGALAIVLFPGALLTLAAPSFTASLSLPELLALRFVLGTGILAVCGLGGLASHGRVGHILIALAIGYACAVVLIAARLILRRPPERPPVKQQNGSARRLVSILILGAAIGAGLLTLFTPRDVDDWHYLAYIRDFAADHPLRSENAVIDMGHPAPARIWYASWWAAEAMLSRATGVDPVPCHQIYLPVLIAPFAVLAVFFMAKQVFRSERAALVGAALQVLFYLSSAYPYNSPGWMVFCRSSQDKALACFVAVPVVVALALRFMRERSGDGGAIRSGTLTLYVFALAAAVLIHPLALVWSGVAVVPFALLEAARQKSRAAMATLGLLVAPLVVSGALVASGMSEVSGELGIKAARQTREAKQAQVVSELEDRDKTEAAEGLPGPAHFYLPGSSFPWASSKGDFSTTLRRRGEPIAANPSYITRYPLAAAGLILTCLLFIYVRRSRSARFLVATTLTIIVLAFVPGVAALSARALTWKLVYRLAWMLPWGLTLGFFAARVRLRGLTARAPSWVPSAVILVAVTLALARGNPANYVRSLLEFRSLERPQPVEVDALRALGREPAPQGVVLASQGMSGMIPAFVADAYPATYRGEGALPRKRTEALLGMDTLTEAALGELRQAQCRYLLLESAGRLAAAIGRAEQSQSGQEQTDPSRTPQGFRLIYQNQRYVIWKMPAEQPHVRN